MAEPPPSSPSAPPLPAQLATQWRRLPRRARVLAGAIPLAIMVAIAWLTLGGGGERWQPLAPAMSVGDATELGALFAGRGIPHRVSEGGRVVEVPASRLDEARRIAAVAGLPRGGVGFEVFENMSLGQSSFAEQVNFRRALQGELARSITALGPVEGARVHVALGKRSVFKDADEPPSASVALRIQAGARLTPEQVRGISQLVAASVEGLSPDRVVVVDQHGEVLSGVERTPGSTQADLETALAARVRTMLERVVGAGHVAVVASVQMDRRRVSTSEEIFDKDRTAVRSEARTGAPAVPGAVTGGVAGVQGNLPGAPAAAAGAAAGAVASGSSTVNYEVSRIVRQVDEPVERVARLHLAILVDHTVDGSGAAVPRAQAELDQLAQLARQAAGFDPERGDALEIRSFPFAADDPEAVAPPVAARPTLPVPVPVAAGAAGGVLLLVVAVVLLWRRRARRGTSTVTMALPAPVVELERALAGDEGALPSSAALPGRTLEGRVADAVRADLPRASRVLAAWLAEPDPKPTKS